MKNIKFLSLFFLSVFMIFTSCEDSESASDVDYNITAEGVVTTLKGTSGKLLGNALNPSDLANSEVALSDANAELTINLDILPGHIPKNISKYQIVKFYSRNEVKVGDKVIVEGIIGDEVVVAETKTLPYSINYNTVNDYLDGLNVIPSSLRIGDQINFQVKVFTTTGNVYYEGSNFSKYVVTVNCASDLAGTYSLVVQRSNGPDVLFPNEIITEVSPGYYKTTTIYRWAAGSIAPDQGYNFNDVCGTLTVPQQGLAQEYYSNKVYGHKDGSADPTTGKLIIYYSVEFSAGPVECTATYTKL